jgi:hypothetical protein
MILQHYRRHNKAKLRKALLEVSPDAESVKTANLTHALLACSILIDNIAEAKAFFRTKEKWKIDEIISCIRFEPPSNTKLM